MIPSITGDWRWEGQSLDLKVNFTLRPNSRTGDWEDMQPFDTDRDGSNEYTEKIYQYVPISKEEHESIQEIWKDEVCKFVVVIILLL